MSEIRNGPVKVPIHSLKQSSGLCAHSASHPANASNCHDRLLALLHDHSWFDVRSASHNYLVMFHHLR